MNPGIPFRVKPMLATLIRAPFHKPGWIYEEKYDGYRILAYKEGNRVTLLSRNAKDRTRHFSHIATAVSEIPTPAVLLDGEVVAFDHKRVSRFQLISSQSPSLRYAVFDCLYADGHDFRADPLPIRRAKLEEVVKTANEILLPSARLGEDGLDAFRQAKRKGLEGIIAKDEIRALHRRPLRQMAED